jgi:hypothetical protein
MIEPALPHVTFIEPALPHVTMIEPATPHGRILDTVAATLYTPWSRPPWHLALEITIITLSVATLLHALAAKRRGDTLALFTWVTIFVYGLVMEILSYNFVKNFVHAQFTVMFYRRQLPLYITAVYPVLLYIGIATARRWRFPAWAEGFAAGILIVALDVPFDILGPLAGFWTWSDVDPLLADRWCGVPVTSYYWHLAFGGILAALTAAMGPRIQTRSQLFLAIPTALVTIVLGVVAFIPLHLLARVGVANSVTVAIAWAIALGVLLIAPKRASEQRDVLLFALPIAFYAFHGIAAMGKEPEAHLVFTFVVTAFGLVVNGTVHRGSLVRAASGGGS